MRTVYTIAFILTLACLAGCVASRNWDDSGNEPIVGLPCEGCEAVFQGLPEEISSEERIAPRDQPGESLRITGTVTDQDGDPAPGVIIYAYHTDIHGIYPPNEDFPGLAAYSHGTLRGWVKTNEDGRYRFNTIRPAGYPDSTIEQHVHLHVLEPGRCTYWIDSIVFTDDPRLTEEIRADAEQGRGGSGVSTPERDEGGTWLVNRNIVLGEGVPDYPPRS